MRVAALGVALLLPLLSGGQGRISNPAFVYELGEISPEEQAGLIQAAGFSGTVFDGPKQMRERLAALDAHGVKLYYLWLAPEISRERIEYQPGTEEAIRLLTGRDTILWLALKGPAAAGSEGKALEAARHISDLAAVSGLKVSLYPHYGFYLARFAAAVRLAEAVNRKNVGVTFNLCHELRGGWDPVAVSLAQRAMPLLNGFTINGASQGGHDWSTLIQPLGRGDFDAAALVSRFIAAGYRGPIGVQCYGIQGNRPELLTATADAWRTLTARVASDSR